MLENFRNLPPVARIIVVALGVSVIAGLLLLIPLFLTQTANTGKSPRVQPGDSVSVPTAPSQTLRTNGPVTSSPQPTFSYTKDPKPTAVAEDPNQPQKIDSKLSTKTIEASYGAIKKGVLAYCTYPKGEDNAARAQRLAKYFAPNSDLVQQNNDFITRQQCQVLNGYLQKGDGANGLYYNYYVSAATQYLQENLSDDSATADLKDYGYAVYAVYVNKTWVISKLTID